MKGFVLVRNVLPSITQGESGDGRARSVEQSQPGSRRMAREAAAREFRQRRSKRGAASSAHRNPLSVFVTMAFIGGLFAVAALPAYAMQGQTAAPDSRPVAAAQSIAVSEEAVVSLTVRDGFQATSPEELEKERVELEKERVVAARATQRAVAVEAYAATGARELGDDYPWPYELTDDEGGGLSPLRYYYRECVDFVAWRLNRDQGSHSAPFKWVWSNLTPQGGNGGQWMSNWEALGRTVSHVPIPGSVAYTGGNHIAYVKSVNADGTVLLEEYNYIPGKYSQRTIPASSVVAFLYPPG